jgi:hypothetical protein
LDQFSNKIFNTFTGFAYKPIEHARSELFIEHVHHLLNKDDASYFLSWLAHIIQYPAQKPGTFILLKGASGTGKSVLGELICALLGEQNSVQISPQILHGSFNAVLSSKLFVFIDEFYMVHNQSKRMKDEFKSLLTTNELVINQKHEPYRIEPSFHRFLGTTNENVPYTIDFDARRESIFEVVAHEYTKNMDYFKKLYDLRFDKEALQGLMFYFKNHKIKENIFLAPESSGRIDMYSPSNSIESFVYSLLTDGYFPEELNMYYLKNEPVSETQKWPNQTIYLPRAPVVKFIKNMNKHVEISNRAISSKLMYYLEDIENPDNKMNWQARFDEKNNNILKEIRCDTFEFVPLARLRDMFNKRHGNVIKWPKIIDIPHSVDNIVQIRKEPF